MQNKKVYLAAAVLSMFFYLIGVMSGLFIEGNMVEYTDGKLSILQSRIDRLPSEEEYASLQRRTENLQLEYAYLSIIGQNLSCGSLSALVDDTTKKVRELGEDLENARGKEFDSLRRDYALLSTKAWILNNYVKERCNREVAVILYFYSVPCQECVEQGHILDGLYAGEFKDRIIVFVLNSDLDEPIVNLLKRSHNVTETPAIVIGDRTYKGLIPEDNLTRIISEEIQ